MSEPTGGTGEKLVEVHKALDDWEGKLLVTYLHENGIEAAFRGDPNISFDIKELIRTSDEAFGIYVVESQAARAKELLTEFISAATDPAMLDETASHKLKVDKETIHRLRGELTEERRTFQFLAWIAVVFLAAGAVLWLIWPPWLREQSPSIILRWTMVILLAGGAAFAGRSAQR